MLMRNRSLAPRTVASKKRPKPYNPGHKTQPDPDTDEDELLEQGVEGFEDREPGNPKNAQKMVPRPKAFAKKPGDEVPISKAGGSAMPKGKFSNVHPGSTAVRSSSQVSTGQKYRSGGPGGSFGAASSTDATSASRGRGGAGGLSRAPNMSRPSRPGAKKFVSSAKARSGKKYKSGVKHPPTVNQQIASFGGVG
jgi:hypothetical protein